MMGEDESEATGQTLDTSREQYGITSALANELATDANMFSKGFYDSNVKPILSQVMNQGRIDSTRFNRLINQAGGYQDFREDYFRKQGVPAITAYLDTAKEFSSQQYADSLVTSAVGDFTNQEQIAAEQTDRAFASRGVSPNSGQAAQATADRALQTRLAIASAAERARRAADAQKEEVQYKAAGIGIDTENWSKDFMGMQGDLVQARAGVNNNRLAALETAQNIRLKGTGLSGTINQGALGASSSLMGQATGIAAEEAAAGAEGMGKLAGLALGAGASAVTTNPMFLTAALKGQG